MAFPHLPGDLWILYVPLYFSFLLVLLALCSVVFLPPYSIFGGCSRLLVSLPGHPACPSSPFPCLGAAGLCPRLVGMDRQQEWAGCQLVWSWMGTVTLWEAGLGRRALLYPGSPSHLSVELLPLLPPTSDPGWKATSLAPCMSACCPANLLLLLLSVS